MNTRELKNANPEEKIQPIKGWIVTSYQMYKGKRLGPYHVHVQMIHGRRKKQYIKKEDLERVRAACQAYREKRKTGRQIARDLHNTLGNINWLYRMSRRLEKRPIRPEDHAFAAMIEKHGISIPGRPRLRSSSACGGSARRAMGAHGFSTLHAQCSAIAVSALSSPRRGEVGEWNEPGEGASGCWLNAHRSPLPTSTLNAHRSQLRFPQPTAHSSQPTVFMDHSLDKFLKQSKKDATRIANHLMAQETDEQKWTRWRTAHAQTPNPRPIIRVRAPLPDWLSRDVIDSAVTNLINEIGGNLLSSKGRGQ